MSEPIIIETPAPPTRERLVLVPPGCPLPILARDATAADLERAGYVTGEMLAEHVRIVWAAGQEAEPVGVAMLRRLKDRARVGLALVACHARDATPADLERAGWVREAEAIADNVLDFVAYTFDPGIGSPQAAWIRVLHEYGAAIARAEKAERERERERRLHSAAEAQVACRNELRAQVAAAEGRFRAAEAERDALRAEVERLTAPGEGEPTDEELERVEDRGIGTDEAGFAEYASGRRALYRLGVAHERARHVEKGRATDEELGRVFGEAYTVEESPDHGVALRTAYLAVAARVRQERCLVAEAVGMGADVRIEETPRNYGANFDGWTVSISTRGGPGVTFDATHVPTADVPATLARLLGEVGRG